MSSEDDTEESIQIRIHLTDNGLRVYGSLWLKTREDADIALAMLLAARRELPFRGEKK
jgi:hypothetical protein